MLQNTLKGAHCVDTSLFRKIEATAVSRHLVLNMRVAFFSSLAGLVLAYTCLAKTHPTQDRRFKTKSYAPLNAKHTHTHTNKSR